MSESIQFRGPLEVEGPDDLDDDDNYMRPGMETAGLKNRQQKEQPSKKSLYFAIACFFAGLAYFYSTYETPFFASSDENVTVSMFGCERDQYFSLDGCQPNSVGCELSVEISGQCVACEQSYYLTIAGNCIDECPIPYGQYCTQNNLNLFSNVYKSLAQPGIEIPYIIANKKDSKTVIYVLETELYANLLNYTSLEGVTIVQVDDYYYLNNNEYHTVFTNLTSFIEKTLLNLSNFERIFVANSTKAQGLLKFIKSTNNNDTVILIEPAVISEDMKFGGEDESIIIESFTELLTDLNNEIRLIYSNTVMEGITCKKSNRILEEQSEAKKVGEQNQEEETGEEEVEEEEKKENKEVKDGKEGKENEQQSKSEKKIAEVECIKIEDGKVFQQLIKP